MAVALLYKGDVVPHDCNKAVHALKTRGTFSSMYLPFRGSQFTIWLLGSKPMTESVETHS
jgi:hypothetical protein